MRQKTKRNNKKQIDMSGIIITHRIEQVEKLKHRGLSHKCVKRHGYHIAHHWLPIQTQPEHDEAQPFEYDDGSLLLFNGEIFNYPREFNSDAEYLKDLFGLINIIEIAREANNWDGFWSIVFITPRGTMYCFTDPLGKKQLYYNTRGEICSEIRPLISDTSEWDPLFRSSVTKWGYNKDDRTPYKDIKRIEPNKMYVFSGGKILNIWPYEYFDWSIVPEATDLEEALYSSVQRRLISKKEEVAALVSGGLDSSIISYILSDLGRSVSYYTTDNLEDLNYVRKLSEQLKFNPHIIHYSMDSADFTDALEWNETPIDLGSMVPEHKLISGIKERIVLTGDGADELFGGYRRIDQYDSQYSDVFEELTYYHLPRLDRASMRYTVEMRNPFLSHDIVKLALSLPLEKRTHKKILKDIFRGKLPDEILDRPKLPLKNDSIRKDPMKYRLKLVQTFYDKQL